jgi:tetratricopeptide (TPR) repeat protein
MRPVIQPASAARAGVDPTERMVAIEQALEDAAELQQAGKLRGALDALDSAQSAAQNDYDWMRLGQAYMVLGAYQRALFAIDQGGTHRQAGEYREQVRLLARQRGLYGVPAEEEPEASAAIERAHEALSEVGTRKARKLVAAGLARWKAAAGLLALRCAIELDERKLKAAEASCARAVAAGDEALLAHYFAGHVAVRAGKRGAAIAHFERVKALDPGAQPAYQALARLYEEAGDTEKLGALRSEHLRRFKKSL